ncbi:MAG: HupE/UreJ family protein [Myxococcota bacterium]
MIASFSLARPLAVCGLIALLMAFPGEAAAHGFSVSYLRAEVEGQVVHVSFELDRDEAEERAGASNGGAGFAEYLDENLVFTSREGESDAWSPCEGDEEVRSVVLRETMFEFERDFRCRGAVHALRIRNTLFMETFSGHVFVADISLGERRQRLTFGRNRQTFEIGPIAEGTEDAAVDPAAGAPMDDSPADVPSGAVEPLDEDSSAEATEDAASTASTVDAETPASTARGAGPSATEDVEHAASSRGVFRDYLWQGMIHIWGGIDHVLFVLCLLLVVRRWKDLAVLVTSFTVAHSITLILGALAIVPLNEWMGTAFVESGIALSILYVSIENLWLTRSEGPDGSMDKSKRRVLLTFAFGLIHGFGFCGVLRDFGMPSGDLTTALLAFNLGVELGQLAIVLPVFPVLLLLTEQPRWTRAVVRFGSGPIAGIALLWFVERAFGLSFMPF